MKIFLIVALLAPFVCCITYPVADDFYHAREYLNGNGDEYYCEWWYLNFVQDDVAGFIFYGIYNPSKAGSGHCIPLLIGVMLLPDGSVHFSEQPELHMCDMFTASYDSVDVFIAPKNHFYNTDNNTFIGTGSKYGNALSWKLKYEQTEHSQPMYIYHNAQMPDAPSWVNASYLIQLPPAHVNGFFEHDGKDLILKHWDTMTMILGNE